MEIGPVPAQYAARIAAIERLGRDMYQVDQWAWHATDAVLATGADLQAEGVAGWITGGVDEPPLVRYVRRRGDTVEAAYDIRFDPRSRAPLVSQPADRRLTPEQAAQFAARELAIAHLEEGCPAHSYNTLALRDATTGNWRVYLMPATNDPDLLILSGDQRFTISPDGRRLLSSEHLSKGCLNTTRGSAVLFAMTEIVSDLPNETQVFDSLQYGLPLAVVSSTGAWLIADGRISKLEDGPTP